jgi:DNA-binding transcriptional MerR regulator
MSETGVTMRIGLLAEQLGVRTSAIRHYETVGVLAPAKRLAGRRDYGAEALNTLRLLQSLQRAGFTLAEASQVLPLVVEGRDASKRWQEKARSKLAELDARIELLTSARSALASAIDCACSGKSENCVLVARLKTPIRSSSAARRERRARS